MKLWEIEGFLESKYPVSTGESWDNCGLLLGNRDHMVKKVLLCLDVTSPVVQEAIEKQVDLIITHHPVIFHPLTEITDHSLVMTLVQQDIGVISHHTNLDCGEGGINEVLCAQLGLEQVTCFPEGGKGSGFLRKGKISPLSSQNFCAHVKQVLKSPCLRTSFVEKEIVTVAVCSGAGGSFTPQVLQEGVDAYVTGEVSYDKMHLANEKGLLLIDGGHFETETIILPKLQELLQNQFPTLEVFVGETNQNQIRYQ